MSGRIVIAAYRPKPGKEGDLMQLVRGHLPLLRSEGLVTERSAVVMRSAGGAIVEVFEWKSAQAIEQAHANPAVQRLWERFGEACEYVTLADLPEAGNMFAEFEPVDL